MSMGQCKRDITPLLMHWSYIFLALTHRLCNFQIRLISWMYYVDGLKQKRRNSIANALELHLSCIYPSMYNCPSSGEHLSTSWQVNIIAASGLVPSGSKPLPEPVLYFHDSLLIERAISYVAWNHPYYLYMSPPKTSCAHTLLVLVLGHCVIYL